MQPFDYELMDEIKNNLQTVIEDEIKSSGCFIKNTPIHLMIHQGHQDPSKGQYCIKVYYDHMENEIELMTPINKGAIRVNYNLSDPDCLNKMISCIKKMIGNDIPSFNSNACI